MIFSYPKFILWTYCALATLQLSLAAPPHVPMSLSQINPNYDSVGKAFWIGYVETNGVYPHNDLATIARDCAIQVRSQHKALGLAGKRLSLPQVLAVIQDGKGRAIGVATALVKGTTLDGPADDDYYHAEAQAISLLKHRIPEAGKLGGRSFAFHTITGEVMAACGPNSENCKARLDAEGIDDVSKLITIYLDPLPQPGTDSTSTTQQGTSNTGGQGGTSNTGVGRQQGNGSNPPGRGSSRSPSGGRPQVPGGTSNQQRPSRSPPGTSGTSGSRRQHARSLESDHEHLHRRTFQTYSQREKFKWHWNVVCKFEGL